MKYRGVFKIVSLKIGYFADGVWSHNAFKLIKSDENFDIKFIVPRFNTKDETLVKFALENNIDYLLTEDVNSVEFLTKLKNMNAIFWFLCLLTKYSKKIFYQNIK